MAVAMTERTLFLGIDLGTSNSCAALFDGTQVQGVRNATGGVLTPSVVRIDAKGTVLVGAKARRLLESDPRNTRAEFKRLMGTAEQIAFPASQQQRSPQSLAAEVLKSLRADVQEQFGFVPARAVISVPALFELPQSAATSEAARLAGFEKVELIQEPIASALAAGWSEESEPGAWMVYDLGGGTFDVSLLETRDGLLRVVGHDGDNYLGGRDFDWVLVDEVLQRLSASSGLTLERGDPALTQGLAKLKLAVEDAKMELSRGREATVLLPELALGPHTLEVDVALTREDLERCCTPLVTRSIAVCQRLLATHGLQPAQVKRLVLVGGPTVMPFLRAQLESTLGVPLAQGFDPMTLVAHGAALYAANVNLQAQPPPPETRPGARVWLQSPAMTSDLTPYVMGRFTDPASPLPALVWAERQDGWKSEEAPVSAEHAFQLSVQLQTRRQNTFHLRGKGAEGQSVPIVPEQLTITHGVTLGDPPLSRTLGVAMANDTVRVYFERGAPLPTKRTFRHEAVEAIVPGEAESRLRIPIVQGEYDSARLCRLVGALEIRGDRVKQRIPAGSEIEVTLELDRGGRLAARALVVHSSEVFEEVAQLLVASTSPEAMAESLRSLRERAVGLRTRAFRLGLTAQIARLGELEPQLLEVDRDLRAAHGGDADASQRAHRGLLDVEGILEGCEAEASYPELEEEAINAVTHSASWVSKFSSAAEARIYQEAVARLESARRARSTRDLQRAIRRVRSLGHAAYYRHPRAWIWEFEAAASQVAAMRDLPRATQLVKEGRAALASEDVITLQRVTEALWRLQPPDETDRQRAYESGVR